MIVVVVQQQSNYLRNIGCVNLSTVIEHDSLISILEERNKERYPISAVIGRIDCRFIIKCLMTTEVVVVGGVGSVD